MDLINIENELKKRLSYPYFWGRRQNDRYDRKTRFIYQIDIFNNLISRVDQEFTGSPDYKGLKNYALNRWYNFWSAQAVEEIFCSLNGVIPHFDKKNRLVDFTIKGIQFDHKTTVYPKGYRRSIEEAVRNPTELIAWLYRNQSQEQRKHYGNRLFIVLYSKNGEHWKLKAEIQWLKQKIESYISNFDSRQLHTFTFTKSTSTLSDIIWAIEK